MNITFQQHSTASGRSHGNSVIPACPAWLSGGLNLTISSILKGKNMQRILQNKSVYKTNASFYKIGVLQNE